MAEVEQMAPIAVLCRVNGLVETIKITRFPNNKIKLDIGGVNNYIWLDEEQANALSDLIKTEKPIMRGGNTL